MREDYLEQIEKMFPYGFSVCYMQKDGTVRFTHNNPTEDLFLNELYWGMKQLADENNERRKNGQP